MTLGRVLGFLEEWGVLVAFLFFAVANVVLFPDVFGNPLAFRNLLSQNAAVGIVALGMTLVIIAGGIDLSVGSLVALAGCAGVVVMNRFVGGDVGTGLVLGVVVLVLVGLAGGLLNGVLVTWGRMAAFVATLVGLLVYRSLAQVLAEGGTARALVPGFNWIATEGVGLPLGGRPVVLYWSVFLFVAVALGLGYLLNQTAFGRHLVAVGSNERAARYSAISVERVRLGAFGVLGLCVGLAAWINASRMNSVASGQSGVLMELDAIAAVVIGGTRLAGGKGRIWGTFVGVLFLGMITTMLVAAEVSSYLQGVVKGGIILLAVLIQRGSKE